MRLTSIIAAVVLVALLALTLVPEASAYRAHLSLASLVVAGLLLLAIIFDRRKEAWPKPAVAEAAKPPPAVTGANQADAEVVSFLAALQEKGRLIDFLMDDLTAYSDAQVGAAARVVHEGCKTILKEHFSIRPVREEKEGSAVTIAAGYAADEYRLVGRISGDAPFSGKLVHRGWKTERVKLPRVIKSGGDRLPTIAPAEVELK
jgi:uncharacterized protein DUF2760